MSEKYVAVPSKFSQWFSVYHYSNLLRALDWGHRRHALSHLNSLVSIAIGAMQSL